LLTLLTSALLWGWHVRSRRAEQGQQQQSNKYHSTQLEVSYRNGITTSSTKRSCVRLWIRQGLMRGS
jgi:hypothetical protein